MRIGMGYYVIGEDVKKIEEHIEKIRATDPNSRLFMREQPEGSKRFWDFCMEQNIVVGSFGRIIKTNHIETLKIGGVNFLSKESQMKVIEIVQQEKRLKEAFDGRVKGGVYSLEEHERLSALARLSSYSREDRERRTKKTLEHTPKMRASARPKELILTEAPEGYITLAQMWRELGIGDGEWAKIKKTYDLPFIKIGARKYFDEQRVLELKETVEVELVKSVEKKPKVKQQKVITGLGEGWISSAQAASMFEIKVQSFQNIVTKTKDDLSVRKIGNKNYFRIEEIERLRVQRGSKTEIRSGTSSKFEVKDVEDRKGSGFEDSSSLEIYFEDVRKTTFNAKRNKENARKVFKGEIALDQLEIIKESAKVTGVIEERIKTFLNESKAKFLLRNFKNTIKSSREGDKGKNKGSYLTALSAARQEEWITKKIEYTEGLKNGEIETIVEHRIQAAKEAFKSHDSLVTDNLKLASNLAYKARGRGLPVADLIGFANEGLMIAAAKYNYKTGYVFSTYATYWIKQVISRGVYDTGTVIRLPMHIHEKISEMAKIQKTLTQSLGREPTDREVARKAGISFTNYKTILNSRNTDSLNRIIGDSEEMELEDVVAKVDVDYEGGAYRAELRDVVEKALRYLTERERDIIKIRFGLNSDSGLSLEKVGEKFGVTRERIRQIEAQALGKLRPFLKAYMLDMKEGI